MISVENLPNLEYIENNDIYEILTNNVGYFTHSFFKYPAKFIPQIPAWAINNFTDIGDIVLDFFAVSGTNILEASIKDRESLGVDFDEISRLLSRVKTTQLSEIDIKFIQNKLSEFDEMKYVNRPLPELSNINHWFPQENIETLNALYHFIGELESKKIKDFLSICFISSIRKSSYSDEQSPKPYVSKKHGKEPKKTLELFNSVVRNYTAKMSSGKFTLHYQSKFIGEDAKSFLAKEYLGKVKLICASPPYINAFDYVRVLRLENIWLRNLSDENIIDHKKNQIGTEQIYASDYNRKPYEFGLEDLDYKINQLYRVDKKRAHIVCKYFLDMEANLINTRKYLRHDGVYVLVIGDCQIRNIIFPVYEYLIELAKRNQYTNSIVFSYLIRNPYLRIPRKERGGLIKYDRIIVLNK